MKFFIFHTVTRYKNKTQLKKNIIKAICVCIVCFVFFHISTESVLAAANYDMDGGWSNPVTSAIAWLLIAIIRLFSMFIVMGVSLIKFTLTPAFLSVLSNEAIYMGWQAVRDVLNMFFIFFLLYSAFCTIFQISRYHIKSTWVMIVVMALLVNFSWPIAHVLVDISNVIMMYIIGDGGGINDNTMLSNLANESGIAEILLENGNAITVSGDNIDIKAGASGVLTALLMGIITSALFAFTIGFIALLLVLRVMLLAIYMVFASVGFAMAAFPGTRSYASQWWDGFTKQLIVGPLVLFSLLLAAMMLQSINNIPAFKNGLITAATENGGIGNLLTYVISIGMIWVCVLAAQRVSGQTAGIAMRGATKIRGALKSSGMGAVKGMDYGMATMSNKASNSQNRVLKTMGNSLNLVRSVPTRVKNVRDAGKKNYQNAIDESVAHGSAMVGAFGGDKDAVAIIKERRSKQRRKK